MASLYDRLKSAQPIKVAEPRAVQQECLVVTKRVSLGDMPDIFPAPLMADISNQDIRNDLLPQDLLFLDTETTGLSRGAGTIAFLIGYGQIKGNELHITQVLMRDYHQEILLLKDLVNRFQSSRCLLTYNGTSFDLPLLQGRLVMNRLQTDVSSLMHLDLLHAARRIFRMRLGRCPLTRLEEMLFGLIREDDLPGSEVPARYFEYLKQQDEALLRDVLKHNQQDIHSLALLFLRLVQVYTKPHEIAHQQDLFSLGRVYERQGQKERAITCYKACSEKAVRDIARLRMAEILRKQRRDNEALAEYETLRQSRSVSPQVYISLAKIYEHRFRDPARALEIANQGMLYCSERFGFSAQEDADFLDLQHRSLRLRRKVDKAREMD